MAYNVYGAITLTGGSDGALDKIEAGILNDGDMAVVIVNSTEKLYTYTYDGACADAEASPFVIEPASAGGTGRWVLLADSTNGLEVNGKEIVLDADGDTSITADTDDQIDFKSSGTDRMSLTAAGLALASGGRIDEFSTDGTMAGNSDTAVPTEQAVVEYVDSEINAVVGAGVSDYKNKIINGMFDIWQRNTTFSATGVSADRWAFTLINETGTVTRQPFVVGQTDVPDNPSWFARCAITTGGALASAAAVLQQKIENVRQFSGQPVTVSFYAKASAGTPDIATEIVENFGSGGTPSADVTTIGVTTHTLSTSWQKFTVTATPTSISGKTMGTDLNSSYLSLVFWFSAGSDYNARTDSLGQQSITVDLAHVQLEFGSDATAFGVRHKQQELTLCQRYYEKSYGEGVNPATVTNVGAWWWLSTGAIGSGTIIGWIPFQVQKEK